MSISSSSLPLNELGENIKDDDNTEVDSELDQLAEAFVRTVVLSTSAVSGTVTTTLTPTMTRLKNLVEKAKRIVVMCGAGVSTSAGIPDFRSKGTGLYSQLESYGLPYPEAIFDVDFFRKNPKPFYRLSASIWPNNFTPTKTHHFFRLLADKKRLVRCYTQNIDSLESLAGLDPSIIVAAHGNFDTAACVVTGKTVPIADVEAAVKGKITWDELNKKHGTQRVKPSIVFFGENLPRRFFELQRDDFAACDLLIVVGTSLQVHPFAGLVNRPSFQTPRILINRDRVGDFDFNSNSSRDLFVQGDCDDIISTLAQALGWDVELDKLVQDSRVEFEKRTINQVSSVKTSSTKGKKIADSNGEKL